MNIISKNLCDIYQCLFLDKHMIFAQSVSKYITINSSKLILTQLYSTKNIKHKNHYDALKITPDATQSEIKSAYYKLSLQYHPDKNKSDYAKQKFQDTLDAYEVLSNHEQRKNYDREMIRQQPVTNVVKESKHRNKVYTGATKIYNFDAWTQAHYGRQFEIDRMRRRKYQQQKEENEIYIRNNERRSPFMECILFLLTIILIIGFYYQENHDVPVHKKEKHVEKN